MADIIQRLEQRLYGLEKTICSISLLVMLFAVAFGVCIRFFNLPIPNVAEWAIVAMSPLTFVGTAMCERMRSHISVDMIDQARSPWVRKLAHLVVALLMIVFSFLYAWLGWILLADVAETGERLLDMGTPLTIPIFFLFSGMLLLSIHCLCELARLAGLLPTQTA